MRSLGEGDLRSLVMGVDAFFVSFATMSAPIAGAHPRGAR